MTTNTACRYETAAREYNEQIRQGRLGAAYASLLEMSAARLDEGGYIDALKLEMLAFYLTTSSTFGPPAIEADLVSLIDRTVRNARLTLHEREELFMDTVRKDTTPMHIMSVKDCAYIFDVCAAGRAEDAREMLHRFVMADSKK